MASVALGEPFGVSKKASMTIICLPEVIQTPEEREAGIEPSTRLALVVDALELVLSDIKSRNSGVFSVLSMSLDIQALDALEEGSVINFRPKAGDELFPLFKVLQEISKLGSSNVAAGGNYGGPERSQELGRDTDIIQHVPAIWNDEIPIIVVGNCDNNGKRVIKQA